MRALVLVCSMLLVHTVHGSQAYDLLFPPNSCPKGIKCIDDTSFVFCENNEEYLAYGKQLFKCRGKDAYCDDSSPDWCLSEGVITNSSGSDLNVFNLQFGQTKNLTDRVAPSNGDVVININIDRNLLCLGFQDQKKASIEIKNESEKPQDNDEPWKGVVETTTEMGTTEAATSETTEAATTAALSTTTEDLSTTTEVLATTEELSARIEKLSTTEELSTSTETFSTTTEAPLTPTEALSTTTEALLTTTAALPTTTEKLLTTLEMLLTTTEPPPTTEASSPTAEALSTTTAPLLTTTEELSTTTETLSTTTKALPTTTEALSTTTEALPTTETSSPTAETLSTTTAPLLTTAEELSTTTETLSTTTKATTTEALSTTTEELPTTAEVVLETEANTEAPERDEDDSMSDEFGVRSYVKYYKVENGRYILTHSENKDLEAHSIADVTPRSLVYDEILMGNEDFPTLRRNFFGPLNPKNPIKITILSSSVVTLEPGLLEPVRNLDEISITYNQIKKLSVGVFGGLSVKVVNLQENRISKIASRAFDNMPYLEKLDLSRNRLSKYDQHWFRNTPSLVQLFLSYNSIKKIPKRAFKHLNLHKPIELYLDYNKIKSLHELAFTEKSVDLESPDYYNNIKIQKFTLKGNNLKCLPEYTFVAHHTILRENKLNCYCISKINNFLVSHPDKQVVTDANKNCYKL